MLERADAAWLSTVHPRLYHVVHRADMESRASVLEHGLAAGRPRHRWHPIYAPRCGHVYLATARGLKDVLKWTKRTKSDDRIDVFAVDPGCLARQRITADEDYFVPHYSLDYASVERGSLVGGKHPLAHFRLQPPPDMWSWDWAEHLGFRRLPSFGEWADAVGLGDDPAQTRWSIACGTLAYDGVVPRQACRLVFSTVEQFDAA